MKKYNINFSIVKLIKKYVFLLIICMLTGCSSSEPKLEVSKEISEAGFYIKLEAEEGEIIGLRRASDLKGFSGKGYVTGFNQMINNVVFKVEVPSTGKYILSFTAAAVPSSDIGRCDILVDGQKIGNLIIPDKESFITIKFPEKINLTLGEHRIGLVNGTPNISIDNLIVVDEATGEDSMLNNNANTNKKRLMKYLSDIYGKKILSGQQAQSGNKAELDAIYRITGKLPAVRGFDFMDYSPSRVERGSKTTDTDVAIDWWNSGGIVTFCWHWNAPKDLIDQGPDKYWHSGFYTRATTFDLEKAMNNPGSEDYILILRDIDAIAVQLKKLEIAAVPVLWRPLHEASGGWFWWGAKGSEPYKKLWKLMYDRLMNYHKLTNLIWVWNGQHGDWYPGEEYVDIVGEDVYQDKRDYTTQQKRFMSAFSFSGGKKMIALTENGVIPDPDQLIKDKISWLWFCTWRGSFVINKDGSYTEDYTEASMLKKIYNHDYVITKDELPELKS